MCDSLGGKNFILFQRHNEMRFDRSPKLNYHLGLKSNKKLTNKKKKKNSGTLISTEIILSPKFIIYFFQENNF